MLASELIEAVRERIDEANTTDISDPKILKALNRALQRLARLSVKHFPEMLKRTYEGSVSGNELTIPNLSQAATVTQVDVLYSNYYRPVQYTSTTNVLGVDTTVSTTYPYPLYYTQQGNKLNFYPPITGSLTARLRFQLKPYDLVEEAGRITSWDANTATLYVEGLTNTITTTVSDRTAFFNIIDQFTGDVKATLQANAVSTDDGTIVFKTTGLSRSSVYGLTLATELPTGLAADDLVCLAKGSCMPIYFREYTDFLIQYSVNDLKGTFGTLDDRDVYALRDLEEDVRTIWSQRPYGARVKANNPAWNNLNVSPKRGF